LVRPLLLPRFQLNRFPCLHGASLPSNHTIVSPPWGTQTRVALIVLRPPVYHLKRIRAISPGPDHGRDPMVGAISLDRLRCPVGGRLHGSWFAPVAHTRGGTKETWREVTARTG